MTNEEILTKKFNRAFTGYDIVEVDKFLDEILKELELRDNENQYLKARMKILVDEINWLHARVRSLEDILNNK